MPSSAKQSDSSIPLLIVSAVLAGGMLGAFYYTSSLQPTTEAPSTAAAPSATKQPDPITSQEDLNNYDPAEPVSANANLAPDVAKPLSLMRDGKRDEAISFARTLVKENPNNALDFLAAGNVLVQNPKTEKEGLELLKRSSQMMPNSKWFKLNYGRQMASTGHFEEAIPVYQDIVAKTPDWVPARMELAELHLKNREFDVASKVSDRVVDLGNIHTQKVKALIAAVNGDSDDGWEDYKRGIVRQYRAEGPGYPVEVEALMYASDKDAKKALESLRAKIADKKDDATDLKIKEVQLLIADKDLEGAKSALDKLIAENSDNGYVKLEQVELLLWQKPKNDAVAKKSFDDAIGMIK